MPFVAVVENPLLNARFNVVFSNGQFTEMGFSRVSGLEASVDVIEYREGGNVFTPRKLPGMSRFPALTFEHGATTDMDIYNWAAQTFIIDPNNNPYPDNYDPGSGFRRDFTINALAADGSTVLRSWLVHSAWPSMVRMGDFDAMGSGVLIETMTVQCEGIYASGGPVGSGSGSSGAPTPGDIGQTGSGIPTELSGISGPAGNFSNG